MSTVPATPAPAAPIDVARRARQVFLVSLVVTALLYVVPYGHTVGYPLVLISTLAHELGHGLAAAAVGGSFDSLKVWPDASGVTFWSGEVGRLGRAFVAAGGLVGPAFAALFLLLLGRRSRVARISLGTLGALLLVLDVLRVRNPFGLVFVALLAAALLLVALKASDLVAQLALVFLAVQLALSVYSRGDYLFTARAMTAAGPALSDVAVIAEALWLPHWLWGILCGAVSVLALVAGMHGFLAGNQTRAGSTLSGS